MTEESQLNYGMQFFYAINTGLVARKCRGIEEKINTSPSQSVLFLASNAVEWDISSKVESTKSEIKPTSNKDDNNTQYNQWTNLLLHQTWSRTLAALDEEVHNIAAVLSSMAAPSTYNIAAVLSSMTAPSTQIPIAMKYPVTFSLVNIEA